MGSRVRDHTVCSRVSEDELYILDLITSRCGSSRSNVIRVALIMFARAMLPHGSPDGGSAIVSDAVERVEKVWGEHVELLRECEKRGLTFDPSRLDTAV